MKPLNLPKESQEALLNGAGMFFITISTHLSYMCELKQYPEKYSPYQIGDEVYLQENLKCNCNAGLNNTTGKCLRCGEFIDFPMTINQKIVFKATIKNFKIIKVQDLDVNDVINLGIECNGENWKTFYDDVEKWYNKQYKNYDENPYIFLYEVEKDNQ